MALHAETAITIKTTEVLSNPNKLNKYVSGVLRNKHNINKYFPFLT